MNLDELRDELQSKKASAERILDAANNLELKSWTADPSLCLDLIEWLIRQGFPGRALDLAQRCHTLLEKNLKLKYQLALAAARGGNSRYAKVLLERLQQDIAKHPEDYTDQLTTKLAVDIGALQGRVLKDRSRREPALATEAARCYEQAANIAGARELPDRATFPLINAATMWRVAGQREQSAKLAQEVIDRISADAAAELERNNFWPAATLGEAYLLLGEHTKAVTWYQRAVAIAKQKRDAGDLASMRNNIRLLQQVGATASTDFLDEHLGKVVVFCGHMVDSPSRQAAQLPERFPDDPALVTHVQTAITQSLERLNAKVGYCSLACGGDILFAEAMLDRGAELHVVLPYAQDDFLITSVDFGSQDAPWQGWRERFERVLQRVIDQSPDHFRQTTKEPFLDCSELYRFAFKVLQGRTVLRARERASDPIALVLQEGREAGAQSFPALFHREWLETGYETEIIDLGDIRSQWLREQAGTPLRLISPTITTWTNLKVSQSAQVTRTIKSMLFADVAGYSSVIEEKLSDFLLQYGRFLKELFESPIGKTALYANTWGDGLYVVFNDVQKAAEFSLELVDPTCVTQPRWSDFGLGDSNPFRVGLHAGPTFELPDIFQGRSCFAGQHVNRAARIEPVTMKGCVYASEPLAASLIMAAPGRFQVDHVGVHALAKKYDDRCDLFHIGR
ncbi:MAG: tetratricopeptide repeat-containing protein [Planctomycetota bacterium]